MNKTTIAVLVIILVILGAGYYLYTNYSGSTVYQTAATDQNTNGTPLAGPLKEFTITGQNFSFNPSTITVNKGDHVKITFQNSGGFHDLRIDEFNAATRRIQTGQEDTITFVADKTGSFEFYCSVGSHRQMGMKGTLIVQE